MHELVFIPDQEFDKLKKDKNADRYDSDKRLREDMLIKKYIEPHEQEKDI